MSDLWGLHTAAEDSAAWYHASQHELPVGTVLTPGGGDSEYGRFYDRTGEGDERGQHVWVDTLKNVRNRWSDPDTHYVYKVEPHEPPQMYMHTNHNGVTIGGEHGYTTPAATITRLIRRPHTASTDGVRYAKELQRGIVVPSPVDLEGLKRKGIGQHWTEEQECAYNFADAVNGPWTPANNEAMGLDPHERDTGGHPYPPYVGLIFSGEGGDDPEHRLPVEGENHWPCGNCGAASGEPCDPSCHDHQNYPGERDLFDEKETLLKPGAPINVHTIEYSHADGLDPEPYQDYTGNPQTFHASTDGVRYAHVVEADVADDLMRLAAMNENLINRLHDEFYQWHEQNDISIPTFVGERGPLGHWPHIEDFLKDRYPAAHKNFVKGMEDAGDVLDHPEDHQDYENRIYETGTEAVTKHGYDPAEIAAGMLLLHNRSHGLRSDLEQADQDRLAEIARIRSQQHRTAADNPYLTGQCASWAVAHQREYPHLRFGINWQGIGSDDPEWEDCMEGAEDVDPDDTSHVFWQPQHVFTHDDTHAYDARGAHPLSLMRQQWDDTTLDHDLHDVQNLGTELLRGKYPHPESRGMLDAHRVPPGDVVRQVIPHTAHRTASTDGIRYAHVVEADVAEDLRRVAMPWPDWADKIQHIAPDGGIGLYYVNHDGGRREQSQLAYSLSPDSRRVNVHGLYTNEDHRNDGLAEAMIRRLHEDHPDYRINPGGMTDDGQAFHDRMLEREPNARDVLARIAMPLPLPEGITFHYYSPEREGCSSCEGDCPASPHLHPRIVPPAVQAVDKNGRWVGHLNIDTEDDWDDWDQDPERDGPVGQYEAPAMIAVSPDHRRQSVATGMFDFAKRFHPGLTHSKDKTPEGQAWADYEENRPWTHGRDGWRPPQIERTAMPLPMPEGITFHHHGENDEFPQWMRNLGLGLEAPAVEARHDGRPVGFLSWNYERQPEPAMVHVHPDYRRHGIATALWDFARQHEPDLQHSQDRTDLGDHWVRHEQSRNARIAMPLPMPEGITFHHHPVNDTIPTEPWAHDPKVRAPLFSAPAVEARHHGKTVGYLEWDPPLHAHEVNGIQYGDHPPEVSMIKVDPSYRRHGIATALFDFARQHQGDLEHSDSRTGLGNKWVDYEQGRARTAMPAIDAYDSHIKSEHRDTEQPVKPGPYFHATDQLLKPGDTILPLRDVQDKIPTAKGRNQNYSDMGYENHANWVWMMRHPAEASNYGKYVYHVQPEVEGPWSWNNEAFYDGEEYPNHRYVAPRARVIQQMHTDEYGYYPFPDDDQHTPL